MAFNLSIARPNGTPLQLDLNVGQTLFILGANGTGKSALMFALSTGHSDRARRISAHRQTWFSSGTIALSPAQRRSTGENILGRDQHPDTRWLDVYPEARASIAIYDLVEAENVRARGIASAVDGSDLTLAQTLSKKDAPMKVINELLRLSNMPIVISVQENEEVVASKSGSAPYSIAQLSDGERNALLIAANILTVKAGTLILIDEPERHLHRSIISPLLTLLLERRPDCAFIVSTHDLLLPLDNPTARTLLVRSCTFSGLQVTNWDADLVPPETEIDGELKKDILGARRKLLFVEGTEQSLDKPLYSLVFPNVSVIAKTTSRDVEHAVFGIRDAEHLHWVHAFGIVDNDGRRNADVAALKERGVYALSVFAVESIYYHPEIQWRVAERHAVVTGGPAATRLGNAKQAALEALSAHIERLSERVAEKKLREAIFEQLPRKADIAAGKPINISLDVASALAVEVGLLRDRVANGDLLAIIERYPVRETGALAQIARQLGFQDRTQYEGTVRKLLMDDASTLTFVKSLFGTLAADIDAA